MKVYQFSILSIALVIFSTILGALLMQVYMINGLPLSQSKSQSNCSTTDINGLPLSQSKSQSNCSTTDIRSAAQCMKNQVAIFYHYNISNQYNHLTESQLEKEGGVCWQYADWYKIHAEALGYQVSEPIITINETTRHEFAVISNSQAYCVMDQLNVHCQDLG